jgi:hypothetical protein
MQSLNRKMNTLSKDQLEEQYDLLRTEYIKLLNDKDVLLQWASLSWKHCITPALVICR